MALLLLGYAGFAQNTKYTLDVAATLANNTIASNGGTLTLTFSRSSGPAIPGMADTFTIPVTYSGMNNTTGTGAVNQWEKFGNIDAPEGDILTIVPQTTRTSGGIYHNLPANNQVSLDFNSTVDLNVDRLFNYYLGIGTIQKIGNFNIEFGEFPNSFPSGVTVIEQFMSIRQIGNTSDGANYFKNGYFLKPDLQNTLNEAFNSSSTDMFIIEPGQTYTYWYSAFDNKENPDEQPAHNAGIRGAGITGSLTLGYNSAPSPFCSEFDETFFLHLYKYQNEIQLYKQYDLGYDTYVCPDTQCEMNPQGQLYKATNLTGSIDNFAYGDGKYFKIDDSGNLLFTDNIIAGQFINLGNAQIGNGYKNLAYDNGVFYHYKLEGSSGNTVVLYSSTDPVANGWQKYGNVSGAAGTRTKSGRHYTLKDIAVNDGVFYFLYYITQEPGQNPTYNNIRTFVLSSSAPTSSSPGWTDLGSGYFGMGVYNLAMGPEDLRAIAPPVQDLEIPCGSSTINLNQAHIGQTPSDAQLRWSTTNTAEGPWMTNTEIQSVTVGTYYAYYYYTSTQCYSPAAEVNVTILPPCDDCGDQIFIEDFGTSDKDVNKGRTTSPYMPASNSFTFATPYPDSNISDQTAIDNNHYAVVAPGYIKSGWKPEDLGWYFWTPAYDEPNTVTDMSGTEEGAVMAVNAGETLAPFYRREVTLEYDTYYHAAFSIFVKNATSRVGIKVGNSSSNQVYGMMFSQEFTSVDAGRWIDVELTFKVPANSDVDCDMENVYLEFFNAKAATQGNDYYIDNIFLEKLDVAGACPTPEDFITLVCPADGGSDCTKEPATGTPDGFTKVGISTMEKQTQGWPENIANGFIALDSKEKGFVITRVESESSITDPKEGMLIYDIEDQCVKLHNGEEWSCLNQECSANAGFTLLCNSFIVISGELHAGQWQSLSGILPFANGDGSAFTPLYNIPSEGITGLTVNITHPEGSTITTGTGGFFNVSISGSASAAGIATFPIEINGSSCSIQVEVLP